MSGEFDVPLHWTGKARMIVRWHTERGMVVDYAVTLTTREAGRHRTVRVYGGAHGVNELHRYTHRGGKRAGTVFHAGTLSEGLAARAARGKARLGRDD